MLVGRCDTALLHTLASSDVRVSEVVSLRVEQLLERDGGHFLLVTGLNDTEPRKAPLSTEARQRIEWWLPGTAGQSH